MNKLATLLLVLTSLVITTVIAGQCNHALAGDAQAVQSALECDQKFSKDDVQKSNKQPAGGLAHFHCCGHAPALYVNPSLEVAFSPLLCHSVAGLSKEARYNSRDVSPLLEPPSHA